jgi:hypothetical protein
MAKQKAKQRELPAMTGKGVAPLRIAELDKLAEAYCVERDKRLKLTPKEVAAKTKLSEAMHRHEAKLRQPDGTMLYRYDERRIILTSGKEKLRVEDVSDESED